MTALAASRLPVSRGRYDRSVTSDADVLIVGAGIIGCAVARELASRGARVQVVDTREVGQGATQASAGVLAPYIEAHEGGALLDLTVRSLELYDRWIESVRGESGVDVEYRRSGSLEIALDAAAAGRLQQMVTRFGARERLLWLDGAAARAAEPALSRSALGALSVPTHGYVSALTLTEALARAAASRGARFLHGLRVARLDSHGDHVEVTTDAGGSWRVRQVVVAAGSWTGQMKGLTDVAAGAVRPVRGQLLHVLWRGSPLAQILWGPSCYLVPWSGGTVLVGATMEEVGFDERNTVAGVRGLLDAARALLPQIDDATFLEARAGLRPATPNGLPIVGPSESSDRIIYATGHYRNGILLAPLTARIVADLVIDGRADPVIAMLSPARHRALSPALKDHAG
jgi:glycine oxidase